MDSMEETNRNNPVKRMITAAALASAAGLLSAFLFLGYLSAGEMTSLVLATISYLFLAAAAFRYRADPVKIHGAILFMAIVRGIVLFINGWNLVFFVNNVHSISGSLAKRDFIEPVGNLLIFAALLLFAMITSGKIRTKLPAALLLAALFVFETARLVFVYRTWDFDMNQLSLGNFWKEVCFYHLPLLFVTASAAFLLAQVPVVRRMRKSTEEKHKNN
jgi:hypothetical protein